MLGLYSSDEVVNTIDHLKQTWERRWDSNPRSSGYEPDGVDQTNLLRNTLILRFGGGKPYTSSMAHECKHCGRLKISPLWLTCGVLIQF